MSTMKDKLNEMLLNVDICLYMFDVNLLDLYPNIIIEQQYIVEMYGFDYKLIHQHGGESSGLLDYYTVIEFKDIDGNKQLVKFNGVYHSYIGTEYVGYDFVEAKEKKVVIYE